jgi:NADPH:quinone reductase-like Zn-dependent oxidoreductase
MREGKMARRWVAALAMVSAGALAQAAECDVEPPATMRAVRLHEYGGPDRLELDDVPRPVAAPGEVLLRVRYASINPIDWKLREGLVRNWWPLALPAVLGRDVSGDVVQVGEGVSGIGCGDAVAAFLGRAPEAAAGRGGYAEYVAVDARDVVRKPGNIDYAQAAAFPLVAVTAWAALVDAGQVQAGERVLVHGGAGGVGSMAVQIAKAKGAHVIATASARNHEFVKSLGAEQAIDYRNVQFETVLKDVDLVIDTVGGDTLARSPRVLRDGGRLVSIAGRPPAECGRRIACPTDRDSAGQDERAMRELAAMIEAGALRIHVDEVFPLERAGEAQERNREGHTRGKIVLEVAK